MRTSYAEFYCPSCEKFCEWGTAGETGHCHGPTGDGCARNFTWHRNEDWLHFRMITVFTSREQYEGASGRGVPPGKVRI